MKKAEKISLIFGITLLIIAAVFLLSLLLHLGNFGTGNQFRGQLLSSFGGLLFGVYGYSSFIIPLYILVAGILTFIPDWNTRRGIYLSFSLIPFLSVAIIEHFCKILFAGDTTTFVLIKTSAFFLLSILIVSIEYLLIGIFADFVTEKMIHATLKKQVVATSKEISVSEFESIDTTLYDEDEFVTDRTMINNPDSVNEHEEEVLQELEPENNFTVDAPLDIVRESDFETIDNDEFLTNSEEGELFPQTMSEEILPQEAEEEKIEEAEPIVVEFSKVEDPDLYNADEASFLSDPFDERLEEKKTVDNSDALSAIQDLAAFTASVGEVKNVAPIEEDDQEYEEEEEDEEEDDDEDGEMDVSSFSPIPLAVPYREKGKGYSIPSEGLLTSYPDNEYWIIDDDTKRAAVALKETLNEFKIEAEVTGIRKGPVITMFEMLPAPGVKLSKIVALADNIALRLAAQSVRIVAPIPGKSAVGIEVPNRNRAIVSFKEIVDKDLPAFKKMAIPVILGKDITGEAQLLDLAKTPHLLIAGSTGSGKSVCVNTMILSILYKRSPQEVKLIMIDPKVVELKLYNDIPHLLTPVITEPKKAYQALQYCLCEMERRYALLDGMGVREISSYNRRIEERHIATEKIPYIVVVIDEFADLMATTGKELESTVARLAAMSRAVGIHLVLATQRPSIDVITGLIKANIPTRIAFMVASKMDSRIIIDQVGAEKLLGKGDMLYASATDPFPVRIQGTFVSDNEVENVVDFVKQYGEPEYIDDEIFMDDDEDDGIETPLFGEGDDPLYEKALEIVMQAGKASASYIQRRLKIGYNRAARLVEQMEERGIVGPANGSKPREVLHMQ